MGAVRRGRTVKTLVRFWRTAQIKIACEFIHRLFGGDALRLSRICLPDYVIQAGNPALKKLQDLKSWSHLHSDCLPDRMGRQT